MATQYEIDHALAMTWATLRDLPYADREHFAHWHATVGHELFGGDLGGSWAWWMDTPEWRKLHLDQ